MNKNTHQIQLTPPFCPNSRCKFHHGAECTFYAKNGWSKTDKPPTRNQRYVCRGCHTQFSANTFSIDFRKRIAALSEDVLHYSMNGMSNNSIARLLDVAEGTVRNRLKELSRQSLLFEKEHAPARLCEDVAYDGFETFTHSQYSPCYINTAVGSQSMFIYHNTFSPLNRKGRMTSEQKIKNKNLMDDFGAYPRDSVYEESVYVLKNLDAIGAGKILYTDEHKSYLRAVKSFNFKMEHKTIPSTARRDPSNPLFPINRLHNLYRHFFSSQQRETISFQKHEAALLEKMQLMKIYRNFMNPKFVKKNKFDPHAHEWSPAMYAGVADKILKYRDIFGVRRLRTQIRLDPKETAFMNRSYPFSRQKIVA
jgi:transposase-like protein